MINARIIKAKDGEIVGFRVTNHGDSIVCAAVSALVINCVNSIETLTNAKVVCKYSKDGGKLSLTLKEPDEENFARILLQSLALGLNGIAREYPESIRISVKN